MVESDFFVFMSLCLMFWGMGGAAFFDKKTYGWGDLMSLCLMF